MQTFSGRKFYPLDPNIADICLIDIAAALSKMTRFGGHCLRYYSVAEHCIHMLREARRRGYPPRLQRCVYGHEFSEAYIMDIVRPIKRSIIGYDEAELRLMQCSATKYDFDWPPPPEVKELDNSMLLTEMRQNMSMPPEAWGGMEGVQPLDVELKYWTPNDAQVIFYEEGLRLGLGDV
jgi:hypothetical protein